MTEEQLDALAQALWRAMAPWPDQDGSQLWENQDEFTHLAYRHLAKAAVDFLGLTEECNNPELQACQPPHFSYMRFVGPWQEVKQ